MRHKLSGAGIASYLDLSPRTIEKWAASGRIPFVRVGPKIKRYNLADVCAALGLPEPSDAEANTK